MFLNIHPIKNDNFLIIYKDIIKLDIKLIIHDYIFNAIIFKYVRTNFICFINNFIKILNHFLVNYIKIIYYFINLQFIRI
jgi:hypothetical protein